MNSHRVPHAPLRIALVASCAHPVRQPFAGGLESHVWLLARGLRRAGHHVTLFAAPGSEAGVATREFPSQAWAPSPVAERDVSMAPRDFLADHHAYLHTMTHLATTLAGDFDLVHNHSHHYLPLAMAPLLPVPMLTTLHTPPTPWLESAISVAGDAHLQFAAVSGHTARAWTCLSRQPDIVPNGVDLDRFALGPGGDRLVWTGRLVPEKAPHLAIQAAGAAGMGIDLAGPLSDPAYYRDVVRPLLGGHARYLGHLPHADLADVVSHAAAAVVTPVWDEPYGLVVAEALACGTPVVAFARGGIPEILGDDRCGALVAPGDIAQMARELPRVVGLDRPRVRAYAEHHCSSARMLQHYLVLYRGLAATTARSRVGAARADRAETLSA